MTTREQPQGAPVELLLVEDNPGDIRLTQKALQKAKLQNRLHVVKDGIEALAFLHKSEPHGPAVRPDLILLDLNLPKKSGWEVLAELKADPDLRRIPVIVLTTSNAESDVLEAYNLHANCYIKKPVSVSELIRVVQTLEDFWIQIVRLPSR
ncbi:MAG: response regulator [Proteobacteria bacterium]|nr:response regulator [Pseudomonadota bacterium]